MPRPTNWNWSQCMKWLEEHGVPDDGGVPGMCATVASFLRTLRRYSRVDNSRCLAGFSQGAMVALDVALDTEDTVAGVVLISGLSWPSRRGPTSYAPNAPASRPPASRVSREYHSLLHRDLAQDLATSSDRPMSSPPFSFCSRVLSDCTSLPCLLFWRSSATWIRSAA